MPAPERGNFLAMQNLTAKGEKEDDKQGIFCFNGR